MSAIALPRPGTECTEYYWSHTLLGAAGVVPRRHPGHRYRHQQRRRRSQQPPRPGGLQPPGSPLAAPAQPRPGAQLCASASHQAAVRPPFIAEPTPPPCLGRAAAPTPPPARSRVMRRKMQALKALCALRQWRRLVPELLLVRPSAARPASARPSARPRAPPGAAVQCGGAAGALTLGVDATSASWPYDTLAPRVESIRLSVCPRFLVSSPADSASFEVHPLPARVPRHRRGVRAVTEGATFGPQRKAYLLRCFMVDKPVVPR